MSSRLVLTRSLTYSYKGRTYRRGVPVDIQDPDDYAFLQTVGFKNPDQDLTQVHPSQLYMAPPGTEVPVIRTGGLGDVLMVLPGLRDLAGAQSRLRFTYVTHPTFFPLLRDCGFLWRSAALVSVEGRWVLTIALRGYSEKQGRERDYRVDCFSRYLNRKPASSSDYPLSVHDEDLARGVRLIGGGEAPILVLGVGSISQAGMRDWPERYNLELIRYAERAGFRVAVVDARPHAAPASCLNFTGRLSIPDLMALLSVAEVVVTPDTGLMHLAEALDRPTVAYFTTVPPEARAARYQWTRAIYAGVPCAPCYHAPTCGLPPRETKCALAVTPERVWREVEWVLDHEPPYHFRAGFETPAVEFRRQEVREELAV